MKFSRMFAAFGLLQLYWTVNVIGEVQLSKCYLERERSFRTPGNYTPRCNPKDGSFEKQQCSYSPDLVKCWNVDKQGRRTSPDTKLFPLSVRTNRVRPVTTLPHQPLTNIRMLRTMTDDMKEDDEILESQNNAETSSLRVTKNLTKCQRRRKRQIKKGKNATYIPQCTRLGHYKIEQCKKGMKKCWCADAEGKKIVSTIVRNKKPKCYNENCGKRFFKPPSRLRRVVGGREASSNTWPWQGLVLFSDAKHICGGTLLKRNWLVTAASCFDGFPTRTSEWNVRLGAHQLQSDHRDRISVKAIHVHPNYKQGNKTHPGDYDVALIKVSSSARISTHILPLCLPDNNKFYVQGLRCLIAGWGHTSYNGTRASNLQEASVDLVQLDVCNSNKSYNGAINDRFMCAGFKEGGVDACHSDTGGPLVCPVKDGIWALAGITSWRQGCAEPHKYGVYTNVHVIKPWLDEIIGR